MGLQPGRKLPPVHEQLDGAILVKDSKAESKGRARHVGAADVQQPGDGIGPCEDRRGDVLGGQPLAQALALVLGAAAGKANVERDGGADRRRRLVRPDGVQGVGRKGNQLAPRPGDRLP